MRTSTLRGSVASVAAAAVVGSSASRGGRDVRYLLLRKPSYQPPASVFPVVWTSLYTDIALTSAATIDELEDAGRRDEATAYRVALAVNLVLNASWTWIFFNRRKLGPAALTAGALAVSSADLTRRAVGARPRGGWALVPYPLWCGFATVLATHIWRLNR
ncbi:tryptophan-rich sensory protein [Mycobacterium sp. MYCO198283]|uniref:TspO/MBR family protein n=1 Tax=Mycobacterium sp. MYCO198283 TaxID=2883505 RepID=UPI001E2EF9F4|nr:TspO/MBR family protein [Mycobacterium sp. MYCO198283]MCG5430960.1 tryptophan-rich sensory protein [Mycobacterium sp. MYCO198283]